MKNIDLLLSLTEVTFDFFEQTYLFGSCLKTESPGDLDILLVYGDAQQLKDVMSEARIILNKLWVMFEGHIIDLTVLSESELVSTGFLNRVTHQRLTAKY